MVIYQAVKTLSAINHMLEADGGATYRGHLKNVLPHMADAYRTDEDGFRTHLGASVIGGKCSRSLWYGFRWAASEKFEGRILRLFNRGHLEEGRFIALLLGIGCEVYQQDENGVQYRITEHGGHFGGSGDGFVRGVPDLPDPNEICLTEFKTHNEKSFVKLVAEGVQKSKPEHFTQMQIYMSKFGINYALYLAVNKNNDDIYGEIVLRDNNHAHEYLVRAGDIIFSDKAPEKISNQPSWYECKWCKFSKVCHYKEPPLVNCRTCKYVKPETDGSWFCTLHGTPRNKDEQGIGCENWSRFKG